MHIEINAYNYLPLINNLQSLTNNEWTDTEKRIKTEGTKVTTIYH